ncbi:MAG: TIGR03943 family protein [Desulfomonile tiedjei]|uniref:TIGR03943 family protein n=1 Tax=Desulfomonile tiedjei TaxID=2358 RepID=A0A9D6V7H7_9BACT|nr:TIGR03943 family protein [Desulfomonile tiedjei]
MDSNRNKASFARLLQLIVLVPWIAAFWVLLQRMGGKPLLGKFLRPDYWWLVEAGTAILVIFLISLVYCNPRGGGRRGVSLVVQMGIMILPLLYLPTSVVSQLSPEAVKKRSFHMAQSRPITTDTASTSGLNADLSENPSLLRLVLEPAPYEGREISVTGMVYWDEQLPENMFFCYQLLMFCCAADAKPIGVLVQYDKSQTLAKSSWVKAEGTVGSANIMDKRVIRISATTVESIEPPKDPYLLQ